MRVIAAIASAAFTIACLGEPIAADEGPTPVSSRIFTGPDPQRPGAGVATLEQVSQAGGDPVPAGPVGRPRKCEVYPTAGKDGDQRYHTAPIAPVTEDLVEGERYFLECRFVDDNRLAYMEIFTYSVDHGQGPSADAIARQLYNEVPLVFPTPHTSPSINDPQLVGFPIWLWVDDTAWQAFDASASLGGVTVTVTAQPTQTNWDMGDGTTKQCNGPGTPWTEGAQHSDCSHIYQHVSSSKPGGRYPAQVTVTWSVRWEASTGESGSLPDASRSTSFSLDVDQRQAVVDYGG